MNPTDTPRTDSARTLGGVIVNDSWALLGEPRSFDSIDVVPADFARQLERELKASKAEGERLKGISEDAKCDLIRTQIEMQLEIDRAEAEVERLRIISKIIVEYISDYEPRQFYRDLINQKSK